MAISHGYISASGAKLTKLRHFVLSNFKRFRKKSSKFFLPFLLKGRDIAIFAVSVDKVSYSKLENGYISALEPKLTKQKVLCVLKLKKFENIKWLYFHNF